MSSCGLHKNVGLDRTNVSLVESSMSHSDTDFRKLESFPFP